MGLTKPVEKLENYNIFLILANSNDLVLQNYRLMDAIESYGINGRPKIYVIGKYRKKVGVNKHPYINKRRNAQEVLDETQSKELKLVK